MLAQIRCSSATIYREFERLFCYIQFFSFSLQELTRDGRSWCWSNLTRPQSASRSSFGYLQVLFLKLIVFLSFFSLSFLFFPLTLIVSGTHQSSGSAHAETRISELKKKKQIQQSQPKLYREVSLKLLYSYLAADQPEPRLWPPRHCMGGSTSTSRLHLHHHHHQTPYWYPILILSSLFF